MEWTEKIYILIVNDLYVFMSRRLHDKVGRVIIIYCAMQ